MAVSTNLGVVGVLVIRALLIWGVVSAHGLLETSISTRMAFHSPKQRVSTNPGPKNEPNHLAIDFPPRGR